MSWRLNATPHALLASRTASVSGPGLGRVLSDRERECEARSPTASVLCSHDHAPVVLTTRDACEAHHCSRLRRTLAVGLRALRSFAGPGSALRSPDQLADPALEAISQCAGTLSYLQTEPTAATPTVRLLWGWGALGAPDEARSAYNVLFPGARQGVKMHAS